MDAGLQFDLFGEARPTPMPSASATRTARSGTFTDNMRLPIHRWFRYSAGFSAEWVEGLVRDHAEEVPPLVLDPFAGSGTTLIAASKCGAPAVGYESHPFVARIAAVKLLWPSDERALLALAGAFLDRARSSRIRVSNPVPELLTKCFLPATLDRLGRLREPFQKSAGDAPEWQLIWLAITAILRPCSHVGTAQWQYVLPNKRKANSLDPFDAFEAKVHEMASDMAYAKQADFAPSARIFNQDARAPAPIPPASVDLVITSPPYPNNYDYADATRLEMTFWGEVASWGDLQDSVRQFIIRSCSQHTAAERLNLDLLLEDEAIQPIRDELAKVCRELAEVRLAKGGKKTYHTMIAAYFADLARVFLELRPVCKTGSKVCFVVGDSAPYGVYVPAEKWLGRLALAAGFKEYAFEKLRDRNLKWKNRKHRVPLHEGRLWIEG